MTTTTNYNLFKPAEGSSGWSSQVNGNFDNIDSLIKSISDIINQHQSNGGTKHRASQISCAGSDVESILENKANRIHEHPDLALKSSVEVINNTLNLLMPDLSQITISANITNKNGGIKVICSTNPAIYIREWSLTVEKNSVVVCELNSSANHIFIANASLENIVNGDILTITIEAKSGQSSKTRSFSHTYQYVNSWVEEKLLNLEDTITKNLTIGNFIDAFAQDTDAIQSLANVLQHSNTLSQKIAELKLL